jgi:uncharacterized membrane protein
MIPGVGKVSARLGLWILAFVPILALSFLLLFAPPDGNERSQLVQFLGRFHPLSVHLPIALLIMVPFFELAGRNRRFPYLLPAAEFLLGVATFSALAAAGLGWCLARSGGYSGWLVTQHMWGGVCVAAVAWLSWILRAHGLAGGSQRPYVAALAAAVVLVSFTGYRGGQLSQGETHLTEFAPEPLASWIRLTSRENTAANSTNGGPSTFYGTRIQPVFARNCVTCHGQSKHKSNLRLDSYDALMRGGKHGAVIKPGDPKTSALFHRVTLPMSDDDVMPPDNRRLLPAGDLKLIELWISSGASGTLVEAEIKGAPSNSSPPAVAEITFEDTDSSAVTKARARLAPLVEQFQKRFPNLLDYQSRGSADVTVNASWMGSKFGDRELAALAAIGEQIVIADLSSTAITDRSAPAIAAMKRLRVLRLTHTKITDVGVNAFGSLTQLESLSVFDTPVTAASLPTLARLPKLRRIYAGETNISAAGSVAPEMRDRLVF